VCVRTPRVVVAATRMAVMTHATARRSARRLMHVLLASLPLLQAAAAAAAAPQHHGAPLLSTTHATQVYIHWYRYLHGTFTKCSLPALYLNI
jgi:hypothetical protein